MTDSRDAAELNAVRRRRECLGCGERFTTFETVDVSLQVLKRDGRYEDFQQSKLIAGLEAACHRTKISHSEVRQIASSIATDLTTQGIREITSQELGQMVMERLRKRDCIAYIRFACVYRRFKDIDELVEAIQTIDDTPTRASN